MSSQNSYVNSLELKSLGKAAENILSLKELEDEQTWAKLIELYSGNPLWLETIAETIKELANGKVSTLFTSNSPLLTEELQDSLWSIFSRLTDFERIIIINLAKTKTQESLNLEQLRNLISVSEIELVSALRSLRRRFLVETENNSQFTVTPVIREFALILE
ncbi:MAG: hypothetical protein ACLFT0_09940 [Spirulinaceae cyanobacterium]